jgi:hypothetical protein
MPGRLLHPIGERGIQRDLEVGTEDPTRTGPTLDRLFISRGAASSPPSSVARTRIERTPPHNLGHAGNAKGLHPVHCPER